MTYCRTQIKEKRKSEEQEVEYEGEGRQVGG
jgi:hypothetical protein